MRFDAVFFDSGGTLWGCPAPGTVPPGTSPQEVQAGRGARLASALKSLGHAVEEPRLKDMLPELERAGPQQFGANYTYLDLVRTVGERLGLRLGQDDRRLCVESYVGPRYRSWLPAGTAETLRKLDRAGVHLGVISNT